LKFDLRSLTTAVILPPQPVNCQLFDSGQWLTIYCFWSICMIRIELCIGSFHWWRDGQKPITLTPNNPSKPIV
jgi:hypothetical protein